MDMNTLGELSRLGHLIVPQLGKNTIPDEEDFKGFYLDMGEEAGGGDFSLIALGSSAEGRGSALLRYEVSEGRVCEMSVRASYHPRKDWFDTTLLGPKDERGHQPPPRPGLMKLAKAYALFLGKVGFVKGSIIATATETPEAKHLMERSIAKAADQWQKEGFMESMVALIPGELQDGSLRRKVWLSPAGALIHSKSGKWKGDRIVPGAKK